MMSDLSEPSDDCTIQSDEEQSQGEFVTHTGYQYELKKKESDGNEPKSSATASGSGLVDQCNRVENTVWLVQLYTSVLF